MILRNQAQIKKNTLVNLSNSWTPPEEISRKNISFAFKLSDFYGNTISPDPKHGDLKLRQFDIRIVQNLTDNTSGRTFANYDIPISKCEAGRNFFYENVEEIQLHNIGNYFCPDWTNLTIQGNWYAPEYKGLTLIFQRCQGSSGCSSEVEFKEWYAPILISQIFTSQQFDIGDYDKPIKYFLEDSWVNLQYGRSIILQTFMKKNMVQLSDNLFGMFYTQVNDYFYQISKTVYFTADDQKGPGPGVLLSQDIILDKEYDTYSRQVYTFTGVLQDIGGFYNSCLFVCLMIYSRFQGTLYFSSIISQAYQVDDKRNQRKNKRQDYLFGQNNNESTIKNLNILSEKYGTKANKNQIHKAITDNKNNISNDFLSFIMHQLNNRWRMKISCKDILQNSFLSRMACRFCTSRSQRSKQQRKFEIYRKGEQKIKQELDCVNIMNQMRQLNIFLQYFFNQRQKFLMMLSKHNLLQATESSDSEDENVQAQKMILKKQKQLKKYDYLSSDEENKNNNGASRQIINDPPYLSKLNETLNYYKKSFSGDLKTIDRRLLFGLITKNPKKFIPNNSTNKSISQRSMQTPYYVKTGNITSSERFLKQKNFDYSVECTDFMLMENSENPQSMRNLKSQKQQSRNTLERSVVEGYSQGLQNQSETKKDKIGSFKTLQISSFQTQSKISPVQKDKLSSSGIHNNQINKDFKKQKSTAAKYSQDIKFKTKKSKNSPMRKFSYREEESSDDEKLQNIFKI
eukprot:403374760